MEEEKDVKKIVIHYEDGTEKVIDKGFFCNMKEEDGSAVLEFTMCHVSGREIELIVEGCLMTRKRRSDSMEDHCVACGEVIPEGRQVCPICNREYEGVPALSRTDNETLICPECGTAQALDDALRGSDMPEEEKQAYKAGILKVIYK